MHHHGDHHGSSAVINYHLPQIVNKAKFILVWIQLKQQPVFLFSECFIVMRIAAVMAEYFNRWCEELSFALVGLLCLSLCREEIAVWGCVAQLLPTCKTEQQPSPSCRPARDHLLNTVLRLNTCIWCWIPKLEGSWEVVVRPPVWHWGEKGSQMNVLCVKYEDWQVWHYALILLCVSFWSGLCHDKSVQLNWILLNKIKH